jgi:glycosyltransferase involved in cell wall biosynthesis
MPKKSTAQPLSWQPIEQGEKGMGEDKQRHLVINGWFWGRKATGSGQYLHGLLPHLLIALSGWRVTLLIPDGRPAEPGGQEMVPIWSESPPFRCRLVKVPMPAWSQRGPRRFKLAWEQLIFPWWCQKLEADVAFVPYWGSPLISWCPVVVTIHDLIPLLLVDYGTKITARAYTWLVSHSARRADLVLAVSIATARDIIAKLRIPLRRIIITYEGLPAGLGPVTDPAELARVRSQYNLPDRYLLYLGGFDPRKNVPLLLKAYARARTLRPDLPPLVMAGPLPPGGGNGPATERNRTMAARRLGPSGRLQPDHSPCLTSNA